MTIDLLQSLLPQGVPLSVALGLVGLSLFTSMLTAALSLGGGMLMLSGLMLVFPAATVLPVHGAIQLGSNGGRAFLQRRHIQWQLVLWFSLGAIIGALAGGQFAALLPEHLFRLIIAVFILVMVWLPRPDVRARGPVTDFIGGVVISFAGMIVGVTGPIVLSYIRAIPDRRQLVGTHAIMMALQNTAKIGAFMFYGFAFVHYLPLILGMIGAGFVGTAIGSQLLHRLPENVFRIAFKAVLTLMALDLLRRGIAGMLG